MQRKSYLASNVVFTILPIALLDIGKRLQRVRKVYVHELNA